MALVVGTVALIAWFGLGAFWLLMRFTGWTRRPAVAVAWWLCGAVAGMTLPLGGATDTARSGGPAPAPARPVPASRQAPTVEAPRSPGTRLRAGEPASHDLPTGGVAGKVTRIMDGDTLEVEAPRGKVKVRLWGVDAPEKGQAAGPQAREALSRLVEGRQVYVWQRDTDRYGRTVAVVYTREGVSANERLLAEGWVWWYREYAPRDTVAQALEAEARRNHRGLWAGASPTPPWEFRKAARKGYKTAPESGSRSGRYRPEKSSGSRGR